MQRKIFFLHIPKTAGQTFHYILMRQFPRTKHAIIHFVKRTAAYKSLSPAKKKVTGVVRGHFVFGLHREPGDEGLCLTFLREPIARTISGYEYIYWAKQHPFHQEMNEKRYSLYDFLDQKHIDNFDNIQVRFLCGDNSMPFGEVNETHLEKAWQNLMSDDVYFGLTERFDESVVYFQEKLQWKEPYYEKINVSKKRILNPGELDEKTMQKIHEVNRYDIELYKRAQKVFEERIGAAGAGFADHVSRFKQANQSFRQPRNTLFRRLKNALRITLLPK